MNNDPDLVSLEIAKSDLAIMHTRFESLEKSIRNSGINFIKIILTASAFIIALLSLPTPSPGKTLPAPFIETIYIIPFSCISLGILGFLSSLILARDRMHYRRIAVTFNRLRRKYSKTLGLQADLKELWTENDIKAWPLKSVSTINMILLQLLTAILWIIGLNLITQCPIIPTVVVILVLILADIYLWVAYR